MHFMKELRFKIGDQVFDIFTGHQLEIIGTIEKPYQATTGKTIYPLNGGDYVCKRINLNEEEIVKNDHFLPYEFPQDNHVDDLQRLS